MAAINRLSQRATLVQKFALFSDVSPPDCASIISTARERRFASRQTIFTEGEPVSRTLLLISGSVKVTQIGLNGGEVILRLNGPGEIVGAFRLCQRCNCCSTAQATQASTALIWDAANFESVSERFPVFRRNAVRALEERIREMEQRFGEVSTERVGLRVSSELIRLSSRVGRMIDGQVEIRLSRTELAQLTGTTLFTVSRLLCQWQSLGIVSAPREAVLIRNVEALSQLAQNE